MSARYFFICLITVNAAFGCLTEAKAAPPQDSLKVRNFVVRAYITLLNTKPSLEDVNEICTQFSLYHNFDPNRGRFVDSIMAKREFAHSIFEMFRFEYLQGVDIDQIEENISDYTFLLTNKAQSIYFDVFQDVLDKLKALLATEDDIFSRKIDLETAQRRMFENKFYDEINMGPENIVVSSFNYLLFRFPTKYELEEGKKMVSGQPGNLFLKSGRSKSEYFNILFTSDSYTEGSIRYWFNKILNREPKFNELIRLQSRKYDMRSLIIELISGHEFMGS